MYGLTDSDIDLILELLETIQQKDVAEKFDISIVQMSRLLKAEGTSAARIKRDYRIKHIKKNYLSTIEDLSKSLNVSISCVYAILRKNKKKEY